MIEKASQVGVHFSGKKKKKSRIVIVTWILFVAYPQTLFLSLYPYFCSFWCPYLPVCKIMLTIFAQFWWLGVEFLFIFYYLRWKFLRSGEIFILYLLLFPQRTVKIDLQFWRCNSTLRKGYIAGVSFCISK